MDLVLKIPDFSTKILKNNQKLKNNSFVLTLKFHLILGYRHTL
jgi:hypothetical protein